MTDAPTGYAHESCPSDELLIELLATDLSGPERIRVDAHLDRCDRCVETLTVVQHRLSLAPEVAHAVPPALARQVLERMGAPARQAVPPRMAAGWGPALWERVTTWLSLP